MAAVEKLSVNCIYSFPLLPFRHVRAWAYSNEGRAWNIVEDNVGIKLIYFLPFTFLLFNNV